MAVVYQLPDKLLGGDMTEKVKCRICNREFANSHGLNIHITRMHADKPQMKAGDTEVPVVPIDETAGKIAALEAELKRLRGEDRVESAAEVVARLKQTIPQKQARARAYFEAERKVLYTAGEDGLDLTINGYRITATPMQTVEIPISFADELAERQRRTLRAERRRQDLKDITADKYKHEDGTKVFVEQVISRI